GRAGKQVDLVGGVRPEVGVYAAAQVYCFANVENRAVPVLEQVRARLSWQYGQVINLHGFMLPTGTAVNGCSAQLREQALRVLQQLDYVRGEHGCFSAVDYAVVERKAQVEH